MEHLAERILNSLVYKGYTLGIPDPDGFLFIMLGLLIFTVGLFFVRILMVGAFALLMATIATPFLVVFATVGGIIFYIVKFTKFIWLPAFKLVFFLWFAFVRVAAVVAIAALGAWAIGYGAVVVSLYNQAVGAF